jgi:hypothetical protein
MGKRADCSHGHRSHIRLSLHVVPLPCAQLTKHSGIACLYQPPEHVSVRCDMACASDVDWLEGVYPRVGGKFPDRHALLLPTFPAQVISKKRKN